MPTTSGTKKTGKKGSTKTRKTATTRKTNRTKTKTGTTGSKKNGTRKKSNTKILTEKLAPISATISEVTPDPILDPIITETNTETTESAIPVLSELTTRLTGIDTSEAITETDATTPLLIDGTFDISRKVLARIAELAASEIDGLAPPRLNPLNKLVDSIKGRTNGIRVDIGTTEAAVEMEVRVAYGTQIPEATNLLRELVTKRINEMTGLNVVEFNVRVQDITPALPTTASS